LTMVATGLATGLLSHSAKAVDEGFVPGGGDLPAPEPPPVPPPLPPPPPPPPPRPPPSPPQVPVDPCQANVTEKDGIVTVDMTDTTRAGQAINIAVGEFTYATSFDPIGRVRFEAPILGSTADVHWLTKSQASCDRKGVAFSHFDTTYFTALVWDGAYNLALHIVEPPDGRIGGPNHYVYPDRPNLDLKTGLGFLRKFGAPVAGTSQVQLYTLPPQNQPGEGDLWFHVEFVSRGNPAKPPYCGGNAVATVSFKLFHLDGGKLERKGSSFAAVPCGTRWDDPEHYLQRWKWKR